MTVYSFKIADQNRGATIEVRLDGTLDPDFPPPRITRSLDVSDLPLQITHPRCGELLDAEVGMFGGALLKRVRADLEVTIRIRRSAINDPDVEQIHREVGDKWGRSAPSGTTRSEIVAVAGRRYTHVEIGRNESEKFVASYGAPLMRNYYVEFVFFFVSNDRDHDPRLAAKAHELIDQIMGSVSIREP